MKKKPVVVLSAAARQRLLTQISAGQASARRLRRVRTLLLAAADQSDTAIAAALHTGRAAVEYTRRRFCQDDLEAALGERPRPGGRPKLDAKAAAPDRTGLQQGPRGT